MADVCVIGLGYVGLPTACLLANTGLDVLGVDSDATRVEALAAGETHLGEAGLDVLVSAAFKSGNLRAAVNPEPSDVYIICVPTPVTPEKSVDLSSVEDAARSVAELVKPRDLVVLESTSPVGTTRNRVGRILSGSGMEPGRDFALCYCPERVLPGNTVAELVSNDRVIGGLTPKCAERAAELYGRFCTGRIVLSDDITAEMCKLFENASRDVNIALANTFSRLAEAAGGDVWRAIELANLHPRVKILSPGPGVGGHCIPVDPWFLIEAHPEAAGLLREARAVNEGQPVLMLDRMMAEGLAPGGAGGKLAVLGVAYKANIDDPRESPAFGLAREAAARGFDLALHDPLVRPGHYDGFDVGRDLGGCLAGAAAAAVMVDHESYRALGPDDFRAMSGTLISDARNCLDHGALRAAGFAVLVLGVGLPETGNRAPGQ